MPDAFSIRAINEFYESRLITFLPLDDGSVGMIAIDERSRTATDEYIINGKRPYPNPNPVWIPIELELLVFPCGEGALRVKHKDGKRIEHYQLDPNQARAYRERKWDKAFRGKL